jgi:tetratricopeptide (TPR) repeat protein
MDLESIARGGWPDLTEFAATDSAEREETIGTLIYNASLYQVTKPQVCRHLAIVSLQLLDADPDRENRHDLRRMQIMSLLGAASMGLEEYDDAQRYFEEVLHGASGPEYAELRRVAASNYAIILRQSDPARAEQLLRDSLSEARAIGASISPVSVTLGSLLRQRGEIDAAIAVYTEAIDAVSADDPDEQIHLGALHGNLGNALHALERHAEAAPHFAAAVTHFGQTGQFKQMTQRFYDYVEALLLSGSPEALPALRQGTDLIFEGDPGPLHRFLTDCAPLLPATDDHQAWDAFLVTLLDREDLSPETAGLLTAARILLLDTHDRHIEAAMLALSPQLEAAPPSEKPLLGALETVLGSLCERFETIAFLWPIPAGSLLSTPDALDAAQHYYVTDAAGLRLLQAAIASTDPGPAPPVIVGIGFTGHEPPAWLGITDPAVLERYARFRDRWPTAEALQGAVQSAGEPGEEGERARVVAADLLGEPVRRLATRLKLAATIAKRPGATPEERLREITELLGEARSFGGRFPRLLVRADLLLATYTKEIPAGDERERVDEAIRLSRGAFAEAERAGLDDLLPELAITLGNALTEYQARFDPARFEEAKAVLHRGLEALRAAPPEPDSQRAFYEGTLLNSLGKAYFDSGLHGQAEDVREATRLYREAYAIRREGGSVERRLRTAGNLAGTLVVLTQQEDEDHSAEIDTLARDVAALADEAEPTAGLAHALLAVATALADTGAPAAGDLAQRAAAMLRAHDTGRLLIAGLYNAGVILWRLGDRDSAIALVAEAQAAIAPFAARAAGEVGRNRITAGFAYIPQRLEQMRSAPDEPSPAPPGSPQEAVAARINRARQRGGLSAILEPEATAEADALAASSDEPLAIFTLGWFSWLRYRALPEPERAQARETALDRLLPAFLQGVQPGVFPAPLLPDLADRAFEQAGEMLGQVAFHFEENLATATVRLWENIVRATPDGSATARSAALSNLAAALRTRYQGTGAVADLDAGIDAAEESLRIDGSPERAGATLCTLLQDRYEASGDAADLDRAIDLLRAAIAATADEAILPSYLINLSNALRARYEEGAAAPDLDEAIDASERALGLDDDPSAMTNLSMLLSARFDRDGDRADLDRAADLMRAALARTPATFPNRCGRLAGLGNCLALRYGRSRDRADIDEAIALLRESVEVAPHGLVRGKMLSGLTNALMARFDAFGDAADLDEATAAARRSAAEVPPGHSFHTATEINLGVVLRRRAREEPGREEIEAFERALVGPAETRPLAAARASYQLALALYQRSESGSAADLDAAIDAARTAVDMAPDHPDLSGWIVNLAAWHLERALNSGPDSDLDAAIALSRDALTRGLPTSAERAGACTNLANALVNRAERSGGTGDLPEAQAMSREAADIQPRDPKMWQNYLYTLDHSYRMVDDASLLETALAAGTEALAHVDRTAPGFAALLGNLAAMARTTSDHERIPALIMLIEDAYPLDEADRTASVADAAAEAERVARLAGRPGDIQLRNELGQLWLTRSWGSTKEEGLRATERALALFRTCLLAGGFTVPRMAANAAAMLGLSVAWEMHKRAIRTRTPELVAALPPMWVRVLEALPEDHEDRLRLLPNLSAARITLFRVCGGEPSLMDQAIADLRMSAEATPAEERGELLRMLGNLYRVSFEQTGRTGHLTAGIETIQGALALVPEGAGQASFQHSLRRLLLARHYATGSGTDLDEALRTAQEGLRLTPPDDYHYERRLAGVAETLRAQAAWTGDAGSLDEAVRLALTAANAYADGPDRALQILELTLCLIARYEASGRMTDLDGAAGNTRHALGLEVEDQEDGVRLRSALAIVLRLRHERSGANADLDEALDLARAVLAETRPDHHARGSRLSDLAEALLLRFRREGARADLDEAVEAATTAASLPSGTARPSLLSRWAAALLTRFDVTRDPADLDAAITAHRTALEATPAGHPYRPRRLAALALTLQRRGEHAEALPDLTEAATLLSGLPSADDTRQLTGVLRARHALTGNPADLDAAITAARAGADGVMEDPSRGSALRELAELLRMRDAPGDRRERIGVLAEAAGIEAAPASVRIAAARQAAELLAGEDPGRAVDLLEMAVRLLPEIALRHLRRSDQERALAEADGLAAEAAELLLAAAPPGDPEAARRALDLLETGRSVLLNQALELDGDLTALRADHPDLAERYERLRKALSAPGSDGVLRRDAVEFAAVLQEIRAQDGYASFPRSRSLEDLLGEAAEGAVVTFTAGQGCGYALLLTPAGITAMELPGLTRDALANHAAAFHAALRTASSAAGPKERGDAQRVIIGTLAWLWKTATGPVLDALGHPSRPGAGTDALPRVWWAPGGLLGTLPLHAAGEAADSVLDRVVSSYTPTIGALRHARRPVAQTTASGQRALVVAMPTTPGDSRRLDHVPDEVAALRAHFLLPAVLTEPEPGAQTPVSGASPLPTCANVLARLPGCSIVHFACHSYTDAEDPSRSGLLLHDHATDPFTVVRLASLHLESAQLAYLSACQTAVTQTSAIADEAIHLASAFQLAGYRHVIGTLWEVEDRSAATMADNFYSTLGDGPGLFDTTRSAAALHRAVRRARDRAPRLPWLWAAYMHTGA